METNQANNNTSLIINESKKEIAQKIDNVVNQSLSIPSTAMPFEVALMQASAISQIRTFLTDEVMQDVMSLQGTKLGFCTDKDRETTKYSVETVRTCFVESQLMGLRLTGNQWNIIAGRCYVTKEGLTHLLRNIRGKLIYSLTPSMPTKDGEITICKVRIEWEYEGAKFLRDVVFSIKVNAGMSTDAILGKVDRKAKAWLYNEITKKEIGDGDIQDVTHEVVNEKPKTTTAPRPTTTVPSEQPQQATPPQQSQPTSSSNANIEEAEIVSEEAQPKEEAQAQPTIVPATEDQQKRFDAYIVKAINLDDLKKKAKQVCESFGLTAKSFNLDIYNKIANEVCTEK